MDLSVQVSTCLDPMTRANLIQQFTNRLRTVAPNPDVRSGCVGGTERIGAWLTPPPDPMQDAIRGGSLGQINIAQSNDALALLWSAEGINTLARLAFARMPRRYNTKGPARPRR